MIQEGKAYLYCLWCLEDGNELVGEYVKKQAKQWLEVVDGKDDEGYIDLEMYNDLCDILQLMVHPDLRCSMYDGAEDYQWFLYTAVLCTKWKEDDSFYYETALLEICRKNFKTFASAVIFIVCMILFNRFSRFFSVAPDYKLSCELQIAIKKIVKSSPALINKFKIKRDMIECKLSDSEYVPLAYSNDSLDGKLAHLFLGDEAGAMDDYPIEAMRSSQITLPSKLGIIVSTQYPNDNNAMITEIDCAKRVLDGLMDDKRYFALLYEPNEDIRKQWQTNDLAIYQGNPVAVKNQKVFKAIVKKRTMAILYESKRENYLCKHNNIMYKGLNVSGYVSSEQIKACNTDEWDWNGKSVYVGADAAETWDNTGVTVIGYDWDTGKVHAKSWAFVPENKIDEKSKAEKFDYRKSIEAGNTISCGDDVLDYAQFEKFVLDLPNRLGVNIKILGYDIRNLRNSAQKFEENYIECAEVKQHSSVLHPTIKWLKELILVKDFCFHDNLIYINNFCNCRCTEDTNLNKYINKKVSVKTAGKIDMVFATLNAMYLLREELLQGNFIVQTS